MIFVDSSAWLTVADVGDGNHRTAISFFARLFKGSAGRLLTSNYVLDETLTLLRTRVAQELARQFIAGVEGRPSLQQILVAPAHYRPALARFLGQGEKNWNFTDCTSFAIMRELGIRDAFAFDSDLQEAGFELPPG